jgi:hypothetical protein
MRYGPAGSCATEKNAANSANSSCFQGGHSDRRQSWTAILVDIVSRKPQPLFKYRWFSDCAQCGGAASFERSLHMVLTCRYG